jgi:Type VI secretion system (T6SS), amidase effector protein 4/Putative peptidoglycan binding domain
VARLTGFDRMWDAYPNPGEGAEEAKRTIGGGANVSWISNTCVLRISRSFNYGGYPIPDRAGDEIATVRGDDRLHYAFRVREFVRWIRRKLGPADFEHAYPPPGGGEVPAGLRGRQGLIVFEVEGWTDATGHIDLWDGAACRNHGYFERASKLMLWEIADAPSGPTLTSSVGAGGTNHATDVRLVQQLLHDRGEDPGTIDGVVGPKTIAAIRHFQSRFLARPDGRVDPDGRSFRELQGL